jgi:hypothetical protein
MSTRVEIEKEDNKVKKGKKNRNRNGRRYCRDEKREEKKIEG